MAVLGLHLANLNDRHSGAKQSFTGDVSIVREGRDNAYRFP